MSSLFSGQHPRVYPSEKNTRVVRIQAADYEMISRIADRKGTTAADALHGIIMQGAFPQTRDIQPCNETPEALDSVMPRC